MFSTTWLNAISHMAGTGPFLHHADGKHSLDAIASQRGTTPGHIMDVTAKAATGLDRKQMSGLVLPNGWPYYTTNPSPCAATVAMPGRGTGPGESRKERGDEDQDSRSLIPRPTH